MRYTHHIFIDYLDLKKFDEKTKLLHIGNDYDDRTISGFAMSAIRREFLFGKPFVFKEYEILRISTEFSDEYLHIINKLKELGIEFY